MKVAFDTEAERQAHGSELGQAEIAEFWTTEPLSIPLRIHD